MSVRLSPGLRDALLAHAQRELPLEACGLLGGRGNELLRFVPCRNALESPSAYAIAPEEILAALRDFDRDRIDLLGIFHSHPRGPAAPSATDLHEAAYPQAVYLIAAPAARELRAFRITLGQAREVDVEG